MKSLWWKYAGRLGAIALVGLTTVAGRADDEVKEQPKSEGAVEIEIDLSKDPAEAPADRIVEPGPGQRFRARTMVKLPDYWLGLECSPVSPAMRSQLKLNEGEGMFIEGVVPESPAGKAGLKEHDLLLSAGDQPINNIEKLMKLLDENKDQELTFNVLRGGEKVAVTVKPEKRPQPEGPPRDHFKWLGGDGEKAFEILRKQLEESGVPLRMQFFHPGMVLPRGASVGAFPDDLHVHIDKHGGEPAKIVVERGDEKWETSEDKLDTLPEDVRPHVESLLGRMSLPKFNVEIEGVPGIESGKFNIALPSPGEFSERLEERLEDMTRRMEQLREQLKEMRDERRQNREVRREGRQERRDETEETQRGP